MAGGDGSVKLYDLAVNDFPVMNFHEHKRETFSVAWNPITKDSFVSSSWDGTVKIVCHTPCPPPLASSELPLTRPHPCLSFSLLQWSPTRTESLKTLPIGSCTYSVAFSPTNPAIISAVSSDSHIRVYDLRTPVSAKYHLTTVIPVHAAPAPPAAGPAAAATPAEILTHDWNKYNDAVVATGGVDRALRTFDVRNPAAGPIALMLGHEYAVRRLAWSPHVRDVLISASYDMTVRLWSDGSAQPPAPQDPGVRMGTELGLMNRHTEFATGVDWCLFGAGGWVASVGWDSRVLLWDANAFLRRR